MAFHLLFPGVTRAYFELMPVETASEARASSESVWTSRKPTAEARENGTPRVPFRNSAGNWRNVPASRRENVPLGLSTRIAHSTVSRMAESFLLSDPKSSGRPEIEKIARATVSFCPGTQMRLDSWRDTTPTPINPTLLRFIW